MRRPSELRADVGEDIDAIVMRSLERDPAKRFETAIEFADALENVMVRPATARAVGAFVQESLADSFKRRRDLLRRCLDASPIVIERPPPPSLSPADDRPRKSVIPTRRSLPGLARKLKRSRALVAGLVAMVVTLGMIVAADRIVAHPLHPVAAVNALRVAAGVVDRAQAAAVPREVVRPAGHAMVAASAPASPPPAPSAPIIAPDAGVPARPPTGAATSTHAPRHRQDQPPPSPQSATPPRFTPLSI